MENIKINLYTKKWVKDEFYSFCKENNTTATSMINAYMRSVLRDEGIDGPSKKTRSNGSTKRSTIDASWRDELLRG